MISMTYCNICDREVRSITWNGEEVCPYHQRSMQTEEGTVMLYDEFNEDGEEW